MFINLLSALEIFGFFMLFHALKNIKIAFSVYKAESFYAALLVNQKHLKMKQKWNLIKKIEAFRMFGITAIAALISIPPYILQAEKNYNTVINIVACLYIGYSFCRNSNNSVIQAGKKYNASYRRYNRLIKKYKHMKNNKIVREEMLYILELLRMNAAYNNMASHAEKFAEPDDHFISVCHNIVEDNNGKIAESIQKIKAVEPKKAVA